MRIDMAGQQLETILSASQSTEKEYATRLAATINAALANVHIRENSSVAYWILLNALQNPEGLKTHDHVDTELTVSTRFQQQLKRYAVWILSRCASRPTPFEQDVQIPAIEYKIRDIQDVLTSRPNQNLSKDEFSSQVNKVKSIMDELDLGPGFWISEDLALATDDYMASVAALEDATSVLDSLNKVEDELFRYKGQRCFLGAPLEPMTKAGFLYDSKPLVSISLEQLQVCQSEVENAATLLHTSKHLLTLYNGLLAETSLLQGYVWLSGCLVKRRVVGGSEARARFEEAGNLFDKSGDVARNIAARVLTMVVECFVNHDRQHDVKVQDILSRTGRDTQRTLVYLLTTSVTRFTWRRWLRFRRSTDTLRLLRLTLSLARNLQAHMLAVQIEFSTGNVLAEIGDKTEAVARYVAAFDTTARTISAHATRELYIPEAEFPNQEAEILRTFPAQVLIAFTDKDDLVGLQDFCSKYRKHIEQFPSLYKRLRSRVLQNLIETDLWSVKIQYKRYIRIGQYTEAMTMVNDFISGSPKRIQLPDASIEEQLQGFILMLGGQVNLGFSYGSINVAKQRFDELVNFTAAFLKRPVGPDWPLNVALNFFESGVNCYHQNWSRKFLGIIQAQQPHYFDLDEAKRVDSNPDHLARYALYLQMDGQWALSLQYLAQCCRVAEESRKEGKSPSERRMRFSPETVARIFEWAIRACLKLNEEEPEKTPSTIDANLQAETWSEQALEFATRSTNRTLADALDNIRTKDKIVSVKFGEDSASPQWSQDIIDTDDSDEVESQADRQSQLLRQPWSTIDADTAVILITLAHEGMTMNLMTCHGLHSLPWNDNFGIWEAEALMGDYVRSIRYPDDDPSKFAELLSKRREAIQKISNVLITPIASHIRNVKHVVFVPTKCFSRLSFSELLLDRTALIDSKSVTQVPSFHTYVSLQQLSCEAKRQKNGSKASIIAQPFPMPGKRSAWLYMAAHEAVMVARSFDYTTVPVSGHTVDATKLREYFEVSDFVHISAHVNPNFHEPDASYIELQEDIAVSKLEQWSSTAKLIFLAACSSGLGNSTLTDDMIGFRQQVLSSGVLAFIGSLWDIDDAATFLFVYLFYRGLREARESQCQYQLEHIFSQAQKNLSEMKKTDALAVMNEVVVAWKECKEEQGFDPDGNLLKRKNNIEAGLEFLEDQKNLLPADFSDPRYWAPFIFVGYGTRSSSPLGEPRGSEFDHKMLHSV